ncbi:MAG TPA: hypothetical protein PK357_00370 [Candidatus Pacearchaeota archaeon]|nr:hypothetical protein [Candidatus Pacearchaeota archaeon]
MFKNIERKVILLKFGGKTMPKFKEESIEDEEEEDEDMDEDLDEEEF